MQSELYHHCEPAILVDNMGKQNRMTWKHWTGRRMQINLETTKIKSKSLRNKFGRQKKKQIHPPSSFQFFSNFRVRACVPVDFIT